MSSVVTFVKKLKGGTFLHAVASLQERLRHLSLYAHCTDRAYFLEIALLNFGLNLSFLKINTGLHIQIGTDPDGHAYANTEEAKDYGGLQFLEFHRLFIYNRPPNLLFKTAK